MLGIASTMDTRERVKDINKTPILQYNIKTPNYIANMTCRHFLFGLTLVLTVNCLLVYVYWERLSTLTDGVHLFFKSGSDPEDFMVLLDGNIDNATKEKHQNQLMELFQPVMTENEIAILMDILTKFVSVVTMANLTFFMYGGTLIGSYRHHNRIPWDDDIDIFMRSADKNIIRKILSTIRPEYVLDDHKKYRWKFYSQNSSTIPGVAWKWPFVDICFYKENSWKIWDEDPGFSRSFSYRKSIVFPLQNRPFGNLRIPGPVDPKKFLTATYNINGCKSNSYDHHVEAFIPRKKQMLVPCKVLGFMYPFVHHNVTKNGTYETLRRGSEILGEWYVPNISQKKSP